MRLVHSSESMYNQHSDMFSRKRGLLEICSFIYEKWNPLYVSYPLYEQDRSRRLLLLHSQMCQYCQRHAQV